ncbi:MAG: hypothetical protein SCARUB_04020 [Candidatus Scalindua rubra]|uniref:Uncharacterized protein n=1 Tax=Candidatus Scalindua rubra TaxID=1872076 RepID=A0A1E3X5J4_9BACT|nr:MAG: hypothetical protein SCARUB_04020 [Candidatus Scalindua rubra]
MVDHEYTNCPNCHTTYRIPRTGHQLKITCKNCHEVFYENLLQEYVQTEHPKKRNKWFVIPAILIVTIIALTFIYQDAENLSSKTPISMPKSSNWMTINYGILVNKSTLTHSGETVGDLIQKIANYTDDLKGLVQQYLEPFSILCHDVLLSKIEPDTLPLVNILSHYPEGSERPTWVDLFREGHYQLYYNNHLIRVFIKGTKPKIGFDKYHSVIRHPIRDVMNSEHTTIDKIEVYVFNNDYANTEIRLNTIPGVIIADELDLSPKQKSIDLASIEEFLNQGVILEAVEVDANNDLYFYGRKAQNQTLAGQPLSLSDIAVIYRSIFHYGDNAPYISLDKHEDNRYAKVNFGGNLENTYAGSVVLEADKLFKTISTGIDPNTHQLMTSKFTKEVPDFLTRNERMLLEEKEVYGLELRYWFYPDSIGTVTDGSIGAVLTHQFIADVERMDVKVNVGSAVKNTIDHLNKNFEQYERADNTFKELSTVGRVMSIINWLKIMDVDDKIELDELLSIKIPAFTTPKRTKKMLAITAASSSANMHLNSRNIRDYTKVYYISDLLDKESKYASDEHLLEVAGNYCSQIDISEIAPLEFLELENSLESINREIEQKKRTLNRYSSRDVDNYNKSVNQQKFLVKKYNNFQLENRFINSIGGGINLRPSEFKRISRNRNAPKLRELRKVKGKIKTVGKVAKSGDWIRNISSGISGSRINKLSTNSWTSSKSVNGNIEYNYHSNSGDYATSSQNLLEWQLKTSVNGSEDIVKYSIASNLLQVYHDGFIKEARGRISSDGKRIVFQ